MKPEPLAPAFAKLERAKTHIADLNRAIEAFNASRPYEIATKLYLDRKVWSFAPKCIPPELEAIAADTIHNIRAPLDKMLTELADKRTPKQGKRHRGISFPTGRDFDGFKDALARQEEYFAGDVIEFLRKTEAYPGGNGHILFAIHDMDLDDKHHPVLIPIKLSMSTIKTTEYGISGGFLLMVGSPRGKHMVPVPDAMPGKWHMHQPVVQLAPTMRQIEGKSYIEFTGPHDDMVFLTTTLGAQLHGDFEPTFNVAFGQIEGFQGKPAVDFLENARQTVAGVLSEFEKCFFS